MKHFILILLFLIFPITAWAACTTPAGVEAQILYNNDHKIVQYCDGTSWIGLGNADLTTALANLTDTNVSPTDGQVLTWDNANSEWIASDTTSGWKVPDDAATCSGGGITGTIRYNSGKIQVCNNTAWVDVGGAESGGVWSLTGNDISNTNTGNVGVGEPSPTTKLHVAGKTTTDAIVLKRQVGISAPTSTAGWNYSGGNLDFSGGNVGIGTSAPRAKLDIYTSVNPTMMIGDGQGVSFTQSFPGISFNKYYSDAPKSMAAGYGGGVSLDVNNGKLYLKMSSTAASASDEVLVMNTHMAIDSSGNVGIGTTNPQSNLDVVGTIRATELCDENGANCSDLSSGPVGGSGSGVYSSSEYVKEFSGIIAGPGNWPACTDPQKIVTIGTVQDSPIQSFLDITVYGSHRGYNNTNYFDHKKFVVLVGDKVSSLLTENNGSATHVNLYDGTTSGLYNNLEIGTGFDIRMSIQPSCGSNRNYTYVVRYYDGMNFTPHATRSW